MKSKEELVTENMRLAPYCVRRFMSRYRIPAVLGLDTEDLISEAFLALCRAAELWDPGRGMFSTYAVAAIHNWLFNVCKLDRLDTTTTGTGDETDSSAISGTPERREGTRRRSMVEMISLDMPVGDSEDERLMDLLPDTRPSPEEEVFNRRMASELHSAVEELPERDREVIMGLLRGENPADMARAFGCSRQRIEQIQSRAYRRLRRRLVSLYEPLEPVALR
jgi:RNA polymerase sigma factor (sigma-70 family)